jgi:hypothetical protein
MSLIPSLRKSNYHRGLQMLIRAGYLLTALFLWETALRGATGDFELDKTTIALPASGTAGELVKGFAVKMLAADNAPWTATSDSGWVAFTGQSAGSAAANVFIQANDNNAAESRAAIIIVRTATKTREVTVTQAGRPATVSPVSFEFTAAGGNGEVRVDIGPVFTWVQKLGDSWMSSDGVYLRTGPGTFSFRVQPNGSVTERLTTMIIAGKVIGIRQQGIPLTVSPRQIVVRYEGEIRQFKVTALESTTWDIVPDVPWIQVLDPGSKFGEGIITVFIGQNPLFSARQGTFSVGSQKVSVNQAGNQKPFLSIFPNSGTAGARGAGGFFNVTSGPDTPWTASTATPWVGLSSNEGVGEGQVRLVVLPNNTTEPRTGSIEVRTARPSAPPSVRRGLVQHVFHRRPQNAMVKPQAWGGIDRNRAWPAGPDRLERSGRESFRFVDGPQLDIESQAYPAEDFGFTVSLWFQVDYVNRVNRIVGFVPNVRSHPGFNNDAMFEVTTTLSGGLDVAGQTVLPNVTPGTWYRISLSSAFGDKTTRFKVHTLTSLVAFGEVPKLPSYPKTLRLASANQLIGNVDNIKVYNRALGSVEEEVVFQNELTGEDEVWFSAKRDKATGDSLIGHWPLDEGPWDALGNGWKLPNLFASAKDLARWRVATLEHERGDRNWNQVNNKAARIVTESDVESARWFGATWSGDGLNPDFWWYLSTREGWNEWSGFPGGGAYGSGWPNNRTGVRAWSGVETKHTGRLQGQINDWTPAQETAVEQQYYKPFSFDPEHPFVAAGSLPIIGPSIRREQAMAMEQKSDSLSVSFWSDSLNDNLLGASRWDSWSGLIARATKDRLNVNGINVTKPIPTGWNHYVFTWKVVNGGYQQALYVNQELLDKRTVADANPWIRKDVWKVLWFENPVDDIRVYDRELTPQDVNEIHTKERSGVSTYTIVQAPSVGTLTKTTFEVGSSVTSVATGLDIHAETVWNAISSSPWIKFPNAGNTFTNAISGVGPNPQILIRVDENPDIYPRTGTVKIANLPVTIEQRGKMVSVNPSFISASSDSGGILLNVNVGAGTSWTVSCDQPWVALPQQKTYTGQGGFLISWTDFNSPLASRTAVIKIGPAEVYLVQRGYQSTVSPTADRVLSSGAIRKVTVTVPAAAAWEAISQVPWIRIMSKQNQSGAGTVEYQVLANNSEARTGRLVIAGTELIVTQLAYDPLATGGTLALGDKVAAAGQLVSLPVIASGFNGVAGFQLSLAWDPSVLRFSGVKGGASIDLGNDDLTFATNGVGTNAMGILWSDTVGAGVTLANGATLMELQFTAIGGPGAFTAIRGVESPVSSQFINASFEGMPFTIQPGSITLDSTLRFGGRALYAGTDNPIPRFNVFTLEPEVPTIVTNGTFSLSVPSGQTFIARIEVTEPTNNISGVNVLDIVALKRHILGKVPLKSGWQYASADVDDNGALNVVDILRIQKAILSKATSGWRVYAGNPQISAANYRSLPTTASYPNYTQESLQEAFRGVKKGDVDLSWVTSPDAKLGTLPQSRRVGLSSFAAEYGGLSVDEVTREGRFRIGLHLDRIQAVHAFQVGFRLPTGAGEVQVSAPNLPGFGVDNFLVRDGSVAMVWASDDAAVPLDATRPLVWISGRVPVVQDQMVSFGQDASFEGTLLTDANRIHSLLIQPAQMGLGWGGFGAGSTRDASDRGVPIRIPESGAYRLMQSEDLRSWSRVLEGYFPGDECLIRIESDGPRLQFYQLVPAGASPR